MAVHCINYFFLSYPSSLFFSSPSLSCLSALSRDIIIFLCEWTDTAHAPWYRAFALGLDNKTTSFAAIDLCVLFTPFPITSSGGERARRPGTWHNPVWHAPPRKSRALLIGRHGAMRSNISWAFVVWRQMPANHAHYSAWQLPLEAGAI